MTLVQALPRPVTRDLTVTVSHECQCGWLSAIRRPTDKFGDNGWCGRTSFSADTVIALLKNSSGLDGLIKVGGIKIRPLGAGVLEKVRAPIGGE